MGSLYKTIAQGFVSATPSPLTTVGNVLSYIIKNMSFVNTDSANSHTLLLFRNGTAAINEETSVMSIPAYGRIGADGTMSLGPSDVLYGVADVANKVTFVIDGDVIS